MQKLRRIIMTVNFKKKAAPQQKEEEEEKREHRSEAHFAAFLLY